MSEIAPFRDRVAAALADPQLAANLLAFQRGWQRARAAALAELAEVGDSFEGARSRLRAAKDAVLADPEAAIAVFADRAAAAGAVVHHAATAAEAQATVAAILQARGARLLIKGKSMVTEELFLNRSLAAAGITVVETDLGEWILQLARELPSHMVIPAIHKNRAQIAELFHTVLGESAPPDDIPALVRLARRVLREVFLRADAGLIGANALIAETGSVLLVTNEGNGDLVTTLPPLTIVLAGWEKLLPTLADAATQLRLLARSATAQPITSFTTLITGAEAGRELHIILVDNGRRAMWRDPEAREALRCIRCAACANVCPPYQLVGGHAFGYIYSGAIGLVNTRFHHGAAAAAGPLSLCLSCHACASVCPAAIPLPQQIRAARAALPRVASGSQAKRLLLAIWARPLLVEWSLRLAAPAAALLPPPLLQTLLPPPQRWRLPPRPALRPARDRLFKQEALPPRHAWWATPATAGKRVALFLQCLADRFAPAIVHDTVEVLRQCGLRVVAPPGQHCCGLPHLDSGDEERARRLARQTIAALEGEFDWVVTPGTSCAIALAQDYERLFASEPQWRARAQRLAARTFDLVSFLDQIVAPPPLSSSGRQVAWRPFCQRTHLLGRPSAGADLLLRAGYRLVELPESDVCCGFGGAVAFDHPEVSRRIAQRALAALRSSGAPEVATENPGCLLHLNSALAAGGDRIRVRHIATLLAEALRRHALPR